MDDGDIPRGGFGAASPELGDPSSKMILMRGVAKRFGDNAVLRSLNLSVSRGESLVIIGGSGTGKSVTLKCVLGLIEPDAGEIYVDGERVDRRRRDQAMLSRFGMLFQGGALFDSLKVWENVAFPPPPGSLQRPGPMPRDRDR